MKINKVAIQNDLKNMNDFIQIFLKTGYKRLLE